MVRFEEFRGEWKKTTLDEISPSIFDGTHQTPKYTDDGIPFFSVENIVSGSKNKFITREAYLHATKKNKPEYGDVLITRIGSIGVPKVVDWKYEFSIYVTLAVVKKSEKFDSYYLEAYVQSGRFQKEIRRRSLLKAAPQKINMNELRNCEVLLPPTLPEQQKIAATLTSLDRLIDAENEKLEALQAHKKGLLQQLFPAKGERVPKVRFGEFSREWEETTLGEVAKFRRGSFPQPYGLDKWYDDENGMPFIQVYDVDFNLKIKPKTKRKISQLATDKSVFIPKGTVIITIQGSIGRVAITQYDAYIDRTLLLFQEYYREIDKLFFAYVLQLLFDIEKRKAPGGIIKTITKEVLTSFIVHIPGIDEQQKIANILSSLDDRITSQSEKLEALNEHKKGLMQQIFPNLNAIRL